MYFVKYGKEYLHDPRVDDYVLLDLQLDGEENSCGFCDFTIYPTHPMYDKLKERDADNPIEVYDDDILLFSGFIYELGKEFYLDGHVKCKGELDYLSESIVRPYSTHQRGYGSKAPDNPSEYFEWLIDQHNSQVKPNKQFTIGINQASWLDSNNYIFRESNEYPKTIDEIKEKLLDRIGGYLVTRHENGIRYIDYLANWKDSNTQILDFGVNLTDYTQTDDALDMATFVVPLGAKMSETEYEYNDGYFVTSDTAVVSGKEYFTKSDNGYSSCSDLTAFESGVTYYEYNEDNDESDLPLTIESLDDHTYEAPDYKKSGDMVYNESAVKKYGRIGYVYKDSDITVRENLVNAGIIALKELVSPKRTIEIKAVDMHLVNPSIKPIRIGEYIRVRSIPHNLDSYFLCVNIDLDLNNPENSTYTLGTTFDTLTGQQNKKINELNATINSIYESAENASSAVNKVGRNVSSAYEEARKAVTESIAAKNEVEIVKVDASTAQDLANAAGVDASEARSTAQSAQELAYAAQADIDALQTTVTKKFTEIEETVDGFTARLNKFNVGGRNLLVGTGNPITHTRTGSENECSYLYDLSAYYNALPSLDGIQLTLSFRFETTATNGTFLIRLNGTPWTTLSEIIDVSEIQNGVYKNTITCDSGFDTGEYSGIQLRTDNLTGDMIIKDVMLELGCNASSWQVAPEDIGSALTNLGRNNILWSGAYHMNASQSINLSANITRQLHGAVFVWSYYNGTAAVDQDFTYFFIPKTHVVNHEGDEVRMSDPFLGMNKYLYVSNSIVSGHVNNDSSGTTNGIAWANENYVLRYVIGV